MGVWSKFFLGSCRPRSKLTGSEWADRYRFIPAGTSAEAGEWRTSRTPYLREPMDAATDKATETVVMMFSSQTGKSEALLNIIGYYADQEPAPQLMVQPTVEMAETFSKKRVGPMFQYSKGLAGKLVEGKEGRGTSRKSSDTIRHKEYPGGSLVLVGANSPAGLASNPIRVVLLDEVDRYGMTKEGDPIKLALQRTHTFKNRKIILVSTPTVKGVSKINDWYERSDKRLFYVPCPHCGERIVLTWELVRWQKDEDGNALPLTAGMYCPECGAQFRGAYGIDPHMLDAGEWVPTNPDSNVKGYHINALYSPWADLHGLVEEFVEATHNKDKKGLMEFINLKLGQPWEEQVVGSDFWETVQRRHEYYDAPDVLPKGVLLLTAGVDVQHDRLECTVYGWGKGKEAWGIFHRVIPGAPDDARTWAQLDEVLRGPYTLSTGSQVFVACTCVDSGDGTYTADVYRYTGPREASCVFSVKGVGGTGRPFIVPPTRGNALRAPLYALGVDAGKSLVMGALAIEEEGPGFVHFSRRSEDGFNEAFFKQLTAEVLERKFERGRATLRWKKIRERNEALDCAVYARAALEIVNPDFEALAEYYEKGPQAAQQTTRRRRPTSRGVTL